METPRKEEAFLSWDFAYSFKFKKTDEGFDKLWTMKASARESLKDWLIVSNIPPKTAENCANACSELIENSIKYTKNGTVATVFIHVNNSTVIIETINAMEPAHHASLQESIAQLQATSDPRQMFVERLLHAEEGKSQLGLIKIVMETHGTLALVEEEDEAMCVKLEIHVE